MNKMPSNTLSPRKLPPSKISPSLVQTWLTLSRTNDPSLITAKNNAIRRISRIFGSSTFAQVYVEQARNNDIEVFIL